ncbi:MAG: hypothetical protein K2N06_07310 [Oscillospiraceae bacterium]|nr:hypothetical protein [Oscillospiraceae bacterium]
MLSFEGDKILDRQIKEASNYCDNSHLYTATFGIAQLVLWELFPIDLDGHERLTTIANAEQLMIGNPGYNRDAFFKISYYNLDNEVSRALYQFKSFDKDFQIYVANLLLDILSQIDTKNGGKNHLAERRNNILERLCDCGFHKELLLDKLSKSSKNRKYKAMVYQCLGQDIGEAIKVNLVDCTSSEIVSSKWITEIPCTIQRARLISQTFWDGDKFNVVFGKREPKTIKYIEVPYNNLTISAR